MAQSCHLLEVYLLPCEVIFKTPIYEAAVFLVAVASKKEVGHGVRKSLQRRLGDLTAVVLYC